MTIQSERRQFPRYSVHIPVNLSMPGDEGETPLVASSLNASLNGMQCTVDRYIPISEKVRTCFALAETDQYTNYLMLECGGSVVKITPEKEEAGRNSYTIALKFDHLSQADQSVLNTIISSGRLTLLMTSTVSVIVPVYNSQKSLDELTSRIQAVLPPLVQCFEIIFVNDRSRDASWEVITSLVTQYSNVRGINLMRNYGQHNALLAGIQKAQYELIVTLDDDLQHPPEEIPKLLSKLIKGYDLVYGMPEERQHDSWRNFSSKSLRIVLKIAAGSEIGERSSAFRAFRSVLRQSFEHFTGRHLALEVLLSWGAARVTHVFVAHRARQYGKSGYTLSKLVRLAFDMLTGYSTLPLRIASGIGLATSLFGLVMFFYVIIRRLFQTDYVPGFSFLASEIALFAGMQLFAIGIIGEYIAQLHFRTMGKPPYVIRDEIGNNVLTTAGKPLYIVEDGKKNSGPVGSNSNQDERGYNDDDFYKEKGSNPAV